MGREKKGENGWLEGRQRVCLVEAVGVGEGESCRGSEKVRVLEKGIRYMSGGEERVRRWARENGKM